MPEQLGDVVGIPILFTLMFTYLFGGALAGSPGDYLQFLLPGSRAARSPSSSVTVYSGVTLNRDLPPPEPSIGSARCRSGGPPRSWAA